jgi:hypothetical protein
MIYTVLSQEGYFSGAHRDGIFKLLKGPKCEIFDSGFFALIRPIWIGDLGTRPKNGKF